MDVEITKNLELSEEQKALLDMHSFLNVMNVLLGELQYMELCLEDEGVLQPAIELAREIKDSLSVTDRALTNAAQMSKHQAFILETIDHALSLHPEMRSDEEIQESILNIKSVFNILNVRVREILARIKEPEKWERFDIRALTQNFLDVFSAIEKNSKGRYRIIYNVAAQGEKDYLVNLGVQSFEGDTITMPPVFQDVMRDLIANARKYTRPGGKIDAGLYSDGKHLRFVVEDTGVGIPEHDIEKVVSFGTRAKNVQDIRTMGGGFGLTKAYLVTKQFNGRMWISSMQQRGTKITIQIPVPPEVSS